MTDPTTGTIVLYAVLAIVTMGVLDWVESRRMRTARVRTARRALLDAHRQIDARAQRGARPTRRAA